MIDITEGAAPLSTSRGCRPPMSVAVRVRTEQSARVGSGLLRLAPVNGFAGDTSALGAPGMAWPAAHGATGVIRRYDVTDPMFTNQFDPRSGPPSCSPPA